MKRSPVSQRALQSEEESGQVDVSVRVPVAVDAERLFHDLLNWNFLSLSSVLSTAMIPLGQTTLDRRLTAETAVQNNLTESTVLPSVPPSAPKKKKTIEVLIANASDLGQIRLFVADDSLVSNGNSKAVNGSGNSTFPSDNGMVYNIQIGEKALPKRFKEMQLPDLSVSIVGGYQCMFVCMYALHMDRCLYALKIGASGGRKEYTWHDGFRVRGLLLQDGLGCYRQEPGVFGLQTAIHYIDLGQEEFCQSGFRQPQPQPQR